MRVVHVETPSNAASTVPTPAVTNQNQYATNDFIKSEVIKSETIKNDLIVPAVNSSSNIMQSSAQVVSNSTQNSNQQSTPASNNNHIVFSIKSDGNVASSSIAASATPTLVTVTNASFVNKSDGPRLISSTTIKPATNSTQQQNPPKLLQTTKTMRPPALATIVSTPTTMPSLAALSNTLSTQQQLSQPMQIPQQIGATKIVQIKTAPTIQGINRFQCPFFA